MRARLESAIESGAARSRSSLFEREDLCMRFAGALVRAVTDHDPFISNDARANDRIRRGPAQATTCVLQCPPHPPAVVYHFS
jgi:hypothetical protein